MSDIKENLMNRMYYLLIFSIVLSISLSCSSDPYKATGLAGEVTGMYVGPVFGYDVGDPQSVYEVEVLPKSDTSVILRATVLPNMEVSLRQTSDNEIKVVHEEIVNGAFYLATNRLYLEKRRSSSFVFNGIRRDDK